MANSRKFKRDEKVNNNNVLTKEEFDSFKTSTNKKLSSLKGSITKLKNQK